MEAVPMTAPISNNPALIDHRGAGGSNNENVGSGNKTAAGSAEPAAKRQDDAVSVSNASQALGSSATAQSNSSIQNANQAAELAQNIASFFAENSTAALAAHGNGSAGLADLLKAS